MSYRYTENDREKFEVPAEELAPWLIGKVLCRQLPTGEVLRFRITETEAYGDKDSACHANKYKTGNAVITQRMTGGTIYVHYRNNDYQGSSFDIVAGKEVEAESVLIRGAVNLDTEDKYNQIRLLGEALHMDYETLNQARGRPPYGAAPAYRPEFYKQPGQPVLYFCPPSLYGAAHSLRKSS